jgi:hypothetical protein
MFADVKVDEATKPDFSNPIFTGFLSVLQDIFANAAGRGFAGGAGAGLQVGSRKDGSPSATSSRAELRSEPADHRYRRGDGRCARALAARHRVHRRAGQLRKPFRCPAAAGTGVVQVGVNNKDSMSCAGRPRPGACHRPGIAAGSTAITLAAEINTGIDPSSSRSSSPPRQLDVMRGLASATITLAAGLASARPTTCRFAGAAVSPPARPYTIGFVASVAVGIHISICWVVDID